MTDKHRRRRDFIQNIVITVLAVSAVLLFAQTQIYSLGSVEGFRRLFLGDDQGATSLLFFQLIRNRGYPSGRP